MKETSAELRELAERFRRRGCTATALLLEADAWAIEHPDDETFRVARQENPERERCIYRA